MISAHRRLAVPLPHLAAAPSILTTVKGVWWALLGLPLVGILHWMVVLLAAWPITLAIGPYGLAVIALTVLVRTVLTPLAIWQTRASLAARERAAAARARIEPQLKVLRRKYKRDPQRLNEETLRLMRESGADPLGSALSGVVPMLLPTLVQLPLLVAMYWAISTVAAAPLPGVGLSFLWIGDLAHPDPILLPLLAGAATWGANLLAQRLQPAAGVDPEAARAQRQLSFLYPLIVVVTGHFYPAALALYWLTSTLVGVAQQVAITRFLVPRPSTP